MSAQPESNSQLATYKIIDIDQFNPETDMVVGKMRKYAKGQGSSAPITTPDGKQIYLRVKQPMRAPFGAGLPPAQYIRDPQNPPWSLSLECDSSEYGEKVLSVFKAIDKKLVSEASKADNQQQWFSVPSTRLFSREVLESMYTPTVKVSLDKQTGEISSYPPQIRLKLPVSQYEKGKGRKFYCTFFTPAKQQLNLSADVDDPMAANKHIPPNSRCTVIIQLDRIWLAARRFGLTLKAKQVMVYPPVTFPTNECLFDPVEEVQPAIASSSATPTIASSSQSESFSGPSIEFEEDDPEDFTEPSVAPVDVAKPLSVKPVVRLNA